MEILSKLKVSSRVELDNGMKATVTKTFKNHFLSKADGGSTHEREYNAEGKNIDPAYNVRSILNEDIINDTKEIVILGVPTTCKRYINADNTAGGWVSVDADVADTVRVANGSMVGGTATVTGDTYLRDDSIVTGNAVVVDSLLANGSVVKDEATVQSSELKGSTIGGAVVIIGATNVSKLS